MNSFLFRRRNYLINKDFQLRFVGKILFGMVIMALIVALSVYYTTWVRIMDAFYSLPEVASQFEPLFSSVNHSLLIMIMLFLIATTIISIFISHKIAGPMFRIERSIETIAKGDLALSIGLRKNDEFKYLADKLNNMVGNIREKVTQERETINSINDIINKLRKGCENRKQSIPELKSLISKIEKLKNEHEENFKLPG